jgi:NitT/TauT family transport system permease protein
MGVETFEIWKSYAFPSPNSVFSSFSNLVSDNTMIIAIATSLRRLAIGFGISMVIGIFLGLTLYKFKFLDETVTPLVLGLQTLPSVCWIPFAMLWFGIGEMTIIFVTAMGATFAIAIATESAIKSIQPLYIKAAKTMGASGKDLFFKVMLPASLPNIISGIKQGWAFAWRSLIAGEMIASTAGLGHTLMIGREIQDIGQVVAVMLVIIVIGLVLDRLLFSRLEKNVRTKWGLN